MTLIKASLQRSYAESFLTDLERNDNTYFLFVAKGTTWSNDNSPPAYTDTVAEEYSVMNNIIGYKKITPKDVVFALPRYEWTSGVSYDQYDDTVELFNENYPKVFYVVTDDQNIYKCIGNSGGAVSTVKPNGIGNTDTFSLSDGYTWKYLATLVESDIPYELTDYMPIDYARSASQIENSNQYNVQTQAVDGSLSRIVLTNTAGASTGVYTNTVIRTSAISTSTLIDVGGFTQIDQQTKTVKITNSESLTRLRQGSAGFLLQDYVGYAIRVESSTVNSLQVGNYGVIVGVVDNGNNITFTVKNDAVNFVITPSTSATNYSSVEIVPFVRIIGNGAGAYCVAKMNSNKTIKEVSIVNPGYGYSNVEVFVNSPKVSTTAHPVLRAVLSPKGGHGSNILRELNVKDVILIIDIDEKSSESFVGSGSYRQFGIIKNPVLTDGTNRIAGSEIYSNRDISLIVPSSAYSNSHFTTNDKYGNIIGMETNSSAKVLSVRSVSDLGASNKLVTLKTTGASPRSFITAKDRINRYNINFVSTPPNFTFTLGETVKQTIPSGTGSSGYGYSVVTRGTVVAVGSNNISVELETNSNFVSNITGATLEGVQSQVQAAITSVDREYGESIIITRQSNGLAEVVLQSGSTNTATNTQYRIVDVGETYFDNVSDSLYTGLQQLTITSSVNPATGGIDITSSQLTRNSFMNGDIVVQGSTSGVSNYARGTVYHWNFLNPAKGHLYLTNLLGSFRSVESHGLTGTTLGAYVVSSVLKPQIKPTSGDIIYIENVRPIQRTLGQEEEFRIRLGF